MFNFFGGAQQPAQRVHRQVNFFKEYFIKLFLDYESIPLHSHSDKIFKKATKYCYQHQH